MSRKPLIGIMLDCEDKGSFSAFPCYALQKSYFNAVHAAGGVPVGIPCEHGREAEYISRVDGVVVPGGDYRFPAAWYADGVQSGFPENTARQEGELALLKALLAGEKPFLGICCGMQVMAVALGGRLSSAFPGHRPETDRYALRHTLAVAPGTKLHAIVGDSMRANTHHREGVVETTPEITVSARAEDGVIEAIEYAPHPFALGVQWHPEHSTGDEKNIAIFRALVTACL